MLFYKFVDTNINFSCRNESILFIEIQKMLSVVVLISNTKMQSIFISDPLEIKLIWQLLIFQLFGGISKLYLFSMMGNKHTSIDFIILLRIYLFWKLEISSFILFSPPSNFCICSLPYIVAFLSISRPDNSLKIKERFSKSTSEW